jgi:hypothetical protein
LRGIAVRKRTVQNGGVWPDALKLRLRAVATGGFRHDVAVRRKEVSNTGTNDGIRLNDQNAMLAQALTCLMT